MWISWDGWVVKGWGWVLQEERGREGGEWVMRVCGWVVEGEGMLVRVERFWRERQVERCRAMKDWPRAWLSCTYQWPIQLWLYIEGYTPHT